MTSLSKIKRNPENNSEEQKKRRNIINGWCKVRRGRSIELSKVVFKSGKSSISGYKYGSDKLTDTMYDRFINGMKEVERNERLKNMIIDNETKIIKEVNSWLSTEKRTKLRLANVVWAYNFSRFKDRSRINLSTLNFTNAFTRIKKGNHVENDLSRLKITMEKVKQLYEENSPFVEAARNN